MSSELSVSEGIILQRIEFLPDPPHEARVLREFNHPVRRFAVVSTLPVDELPPVTDVSGSFDTLLFLFLPQGTVTAFEWQKHAEEWMSAPACAGLPPTIEVILRSDRFLWRPGRAIMFGAHERMEETLAGLVDFAFYEGELRRLEYEVDSEWSTLEKDIPLTHSVGSVQLRCRRHVDQRTQLVADWRIRFARLEPRLEKASTSLTPPARRLFSELAVHADVLDKLSAADDQIDVYADLYEVANNRLTEFNYARQGFWLEMGIIIILIVEILVMLLGLAS